jgi:hypothetical protein
LRVLSQEHQPDTSQAQQRDLPIGEHPHADQEMTRVLRTAPLRVASDPSNGVITFWRHDSLHDIVKPMVDHVIMAFPAEPVRFERRDGKAFVNGAIGGDACSEHCRFQMQPRKDTGMKTFLSIGAGPGMGFATAERFANEDFQTILAARSVARTQELAERLISKG